MLYQFVLDQIGILKLIDLDMPVSFLVSGQDLRAIPEQLYRFHQQVIKIKGIAFPEHLLVALIDPSHHLTKIAIALS